MYENERSVQMLLKTIASYNGDPRYDRKFVARGVARCNCPEQRRRQDDLARLQMDTFRSCFNHCFFQQYANPSLPKLG